MGSTADPARGPAAGAPPPVAAGKAPDAAAAMEAGGAGGKASAELDRIYARVTLAVAPLFALTTMMSTIDRCGAARVWLDELRNCSRARSPPGRPRARPACSQRALLSSRPTLILLSARARPRPTPRRGPRGNLSYASISLIPALKLSPTAYGARRAAPPPRRRGGPAAAAAAAQCSASGGPACGATRAALAPAGPLFHRPHSWTPHELTPV